MLPNRTFHRRTAGVLVAAGFACLALLGRLLWLETVHGVDLNRRAVGERMRDVPLVAPRGYILDRAGRVLAASETVYAAYAVPAEVRDKASAAVRVARILDVPVKTVLTRIRQRVALTWLKKRLTPAQSETIRALGIRGIALAPEVKRVYPYGSLASDVVGFTGIDSQGLGGVELSYESVLKGKNGAIRVEYDARNRRIQNARTDYQQPVSGDSLVLTLDMGLQELAEEDLREAVVQSGSQGGMVISMDVRTGGILALAVEPGFDPNLYGRYDLNRFRNEAFSDSYPPGSTFKPVTAAAALAEGVVTPDSPFYDPGFVRVDGRTIRCWKAGGHGSETFTSVVHNSCNVGFVETGLRLGTKRFYLYLRHFGFLGRTGIDLPGEAKGLVPPSRLVKRVDLAVMSFGQTLTVTPLALADAISAIANGGMLERPHVLSEIVSARGTVLERVGAEPVGRVVPVRVADEVASMMAGVVSEGTGKNAQVPGYRVAGKTGTSQVLLNGRYEPGQYIASFVGFGPVPNPRILTLVILDHPSGVYYGGQVAAPVFARFMASALPYLGIRPSEPPEQVRKETQDLPLVTVPRLQGESASRALETLRGMGFYVRVVGPPAPYVEGTLPAPGERAPGGEVLLFEGAFAPPGAHQARPKRAS